MSEPSAVPPAREVPEKNDWDLHILADRTDPTDPMRGIDIVAIHGMSGHWFNSWKDVASGAMWLQDFLPFQVANARTMSYGWPADIVQFSSPFRLRISSDETANQLLSKLINARTGGREKRPIIFIAHSTGGILLKQVLINALFRFDIFQCIRGLVFFGTPHRGAMEDLVKHTRHIGYLTKLSGFGRPMGHFRDDDPLNLFSKSSKDVLEDLNDRFLGALRLTNRLSILSFYELSKIRIPLGYDTKMVDKYSAQLGLVQSETVLGIDDDHTNMNKFSSIDSPKYRIVWENIKYMAESVHDSRPLEGAKSYSPFDSDVAEPIGESEILKGQRADKWFSNFQAEVQEVIEERIKDRDVPVKIAVIDTGIDYAHPLITARHSQIQECLSFLDGHDAKEDTHGHGTHVTHLLMRTAPRAKIFSARAFLDGREGELERNMMGIANAIRHAATVWEVDIISMSWGGRHEIPEIKSAIREAFHRGVSMFAAASNDGRISTVAFPANLRQVICVNSYDGYGQPSHFNPPPKSGTNLAVIGEFVESAWPVGLSNSNTARLTGTSVATPIAAGIAAITLEYARQQGPRGSRVEGPDQLRHCDEVRKVLRCMLRDADGPYQCLFPSELFYKRFEDRTMHPVICSRINDTLNGLEYSA